MAIEARRRRAEDRRFGTVQKQLTSAGVVNTKAGSARRRHTARPGRDEVSMPARRRARAAGPAPEPRQHARPSRPNRKDRAPRDADRQEPRPLSRAMISFGLVTIP